MSDRKVRFAILGTAKIARTVGPQIQASTGAEVTAIASRDLERATAFGDELGIPKRFGGYQEALYDPEIDAVYIPLPPSMHLEWVTKAAEAGKHVLCEKALAMNAAEVATMTGVCQQHNVVLLDGVMWYHTPRAAAIRNILALRQLGELRQLNSVFTFRWESYPMDNMRMHRKLGGGSLLDLGWYCVGVALWLFDGMPHRVFSKAQYHNDVDIRMNGFLWFDGGRVATIECGFDTAKRRWVEIAGSKKNLVCDDFTRPLNPEKARFWTHDDGGSATEHVIPQKRQEECMVDAFCDLIRNGTTIHPWLELSRRTQQVCDALDKSARTQQEIDVS